MYVRMKALDSRGEYIIAELFIDGYGTQYVGPREGEHLFRTWDEPGKLLSVWVERAETIEPNWRQHLTITLGD
jgi:hypothetical protein